MHTYYCVVGRKANTVCSSVLLLAIGSIYEDYAAVLSFWKSVSSLLLHIVFALWRNKGGLRVPDEIYVCRVDALLMQQANAMLCSPLNAAKQFQRDM
jgi:hypothetical protein